MPSPCQTLLHAAVENGYFFEVMAERYTDSSHVRGILLQSFLFEISRNQEDVVAVDILSPVK